MAVLWCGRIPAGLLVTVVARGARQQADDSAGRHEDPGGDENSLAALRTAFTDVMGDPAWRHLPIWYLIATRDQAIRADAQRPFARRLDAITPQRGHSSLTVGRAQ